ncbi:hypothetical protein F4825DRAFT_261735 [Nemania diffusa]|nr:hypothetical protein F4825DRAFT_261735 [Nemania diffusa]
MTATYVMQQIQCRSTCVSLFPMVAYSIVSACLLSPPSIRLVVLFSLPSYVFIWMGVDPFPPTSLLASLNSSLDRRGDVGRHELCSYAMYVFLYTYSASAGTVSVSTRAGMYVHTFQYREIGRQCVSRRRITSSSVRDKDLPAYLKSICAAPFSSK